MRSAAARCLLRPRGMQIVDSCSRIRASSSSFMAPKVPRSSSEKPRTNLALNSVRYDKAHNSSIITPLRTQRRGIASLTSQSHLLLGSAAHNNSLFRLQSVRRKSDEGIKKDESSNRVSSGGEKPVPEKTSIPVKGTAEQESSTHKIASGAAAATQQLQERIAGVVNDLNLGDQLAVVLIAVFTAILLTAPYAVRHMKKATNNNNYDERMQTDDVVDEFAKLARDEWGFEDGEAGEEGNGNKKNIVDLLLKDVFKSQALQHAAQEFVVQIIQSDRFKEAISRLVKELWSDLVTDPETLAQVVKLLEVAIQNPQIKLAAQELVLHVFVQEAAVREALIGMVEKLGDDDLVRQAVIRLLTDAAHTTLNDPELLDHSMEFATDVVGDDIVQQTAGDALRKSIGHAVRPATSVLLTAAGVGFLIFSVVAVGYSRSSEQEAVLFESAARSLRSNASFGIVRIITWPLRQLQIGVCKASSAFWVLVGPSFAALLESVRGMTGAAVLAVGDFAVHVLALPWLGVKAGARWVFATVSTAMGGVLERFQSRQRSLSIKSVSSLVGSAVVSASVALWSTTVSCWHRIERISAAGISLVSDYVGAVWTRLLFLLQELRGGSTEKP